MTHPDPSQLAAFLDGRLSVDEQQSVERHIETCDECCEAMSRLPQDTLSAQLRDVETDAGLSAESVPVEAETEPGLIPAGLVDHPRYRILSPLGKGGMGMVFKAEHRMMGRLVAIKVINAKLIEHPQAVARFRAEVQAAGRLSHPNIVQAYDAEQAGDVHFLAMEYVDGISLAELVHRKGPLPFRQTAAIVRKVAHGLHHAFKQGMVHRDIKPQNIMINQEGKVRVLDFGLARLVRERETEPANELAPMDRMRRTADALTMLGSVLGTPDYIAPEQVEDSHQADTRADIYSLGCTCYYLLTGQPPFAGGTVMEKLLAHTEQTAPGIESLRADVPAQLVQLVAKMMQRSPDARFQTPIEVAQACDLFLGASSPATTPTLGGVIENTLGPEAARLPPEVALAAVVGELSTSELPPLPARRTRKKKDKRRRNRLPRAAVALVASLAVLGLIFLAVRGILDSAGGGYEAVPELGNDQQSNEAGEWDDLLASADPAAARQGQWTRQGSKLHVSPNKYARLQLAENLPDEYDFEVSFTRLVGQDSVALMFAMNGRVASFELDAWGRNLAGIQKIDGLSLQERDPSQVRVWDLQDGKLYTVRLEVRSQGVRVFVDGVELTDCEYVGDGTNLSLLPDWDLRTTNVGTQSTVGIGAYLSETIFHTARLRRYD